MANRFILNETSYHGFGAIKNIVPEIQARGFKNILVASDASLVKFGVTQKVTGLLDEAGIKYELFTDIKPNPTIENVLSGVEAAKKINADAIIAIGGGSSMDTAKAVGIIMTNPQHADVRSLEGAVAGTKPCLPIIAVPTTAGTAAEVTINYVITDVQNKRKFVCVDPHDIPVVAIGGIHRGNIASLAGTGIRGAAVVSGIFAAADIEEECFRLRAEIDRIVK